MKGQNTFAETSASPEQVLGIFRDWQRLELGRCMRERDLLSFTTTVSGWRASCDLQGWQELGVALNKYFGTTVSKDEWRATMKPEKKKYLRDVCALIATRAKLPTPGDQKVFGKPCKPASSFFALRSCLQLAGVDTAHLRPSTKLDSCLRLHTQDVIEAVTKLAPGKMPQMATKFNWRHRLSGWVCLGGLLTLVAGGILERPEWTVVGCLFLALGFIAVTVFSNLPPSEVRLEGLETFGDLSRMIANGERNL